MKENDMSAKRAFENFREAQAQLQRTSEELEDFIRPVINDLLALRKKYGRFSETHDILRHIENEYYEWEIDKDKTNPVWITCNWNENWREGGGDSGSFQFPLYFIFEPDQYTQWKANLVVQYQEYLKRTEESTLKKKREELKRLKAELGED